MRENQRKRRLFTGVTVERRFTDLPSTTPGRRRLTVPAEGSGRPGGMSEQRDGERGLAAPHFILTFHLQ